MARTHSFALRRAGTRTRVTLGLRIFTLRSSLVWVAVSLGMAAGCSDSDASSSPAPPATAEPPRPRLHPEERAYREERDVLDDTTVAGLEALGYLPTAPTDNPDQRGVTRSTASPGADAVHLYSSRRRASAHLVDMDGEILHSWRARNLAPGYAWMHVEPLEGGELLAISKDHHVTRYTWDGEVVFRTPINAHHDLAVLEGGRVLVLVRDRSELTYRGERLPVLVDSVVELSPDGEVAVETPLLPLFRPHLRERQLDRLLRAFRRAQEPAARRRLLRAGGIGDVLHTNSIEVLDDPIEGVAPAGAILLSFRALSRVAIVDPGFEEVLWLWGEGELDGQHDATQVEGGRILLFDNGLRRGPPSRVVEVDVTTNEITWSYSNDDLYSQLRGGAQALSNGNVLLTEADRGHALEVGRDGEVVWEFWNPDVRRIQGELERGVLYRFNRYPRAMFPLQSRTPGDSDNRVTRVPGTERRAPAD